MLNVLGQPHAMMKRRIVVPAICAAVLSPAFGACSEPVGEGRPQDAERPPTELAGREPRSKVPTADGGPEMNVFEEEDAVMPYDPGDESAARSEAGRIKEKHEARLLAMDGVEGVGLGTDAVGEDVIVLYLRDGGFRAQVPTEIEGVPVTTEVTGIIDAY